MNDTIGAGPAPGFKKKPDYRVDIERTPRRLRVEFNGEILADTTRGLLMRETGHTPVYYFPREDARLDIMERTDHGTHCPFKGDASYWTVRVGGREAENAVWSYEDPFTECLPIKDCLSFYWKKVDHWYEEDEEIFVHPRDPYKRVDVVRSSRLVRIVLGGEVVAESTGSHFLFETGLPTRYYLPGDDVRMDLLEPTDSTTSCPYKGDAVYWRAAVGGQTFEDIVWSYPAPVAECTKITGLMCFYNENVDDIFVDGETVPKVKTKWSRE